MYPFASQASRSVWSFFKTNFETFFSQNKFKDDIFNFQITQLLEKLYFLIRFKKESPVLILLFNKI